ncbi:MULTISPECIES: hypothetical protein [unclassified Microbacterium]|uniref:hypothetical protein n=1 Tax=unclassified Microbacterium TaxID=2609290 RepID=UPI00288331DE|nr:MULTISPECIES: hypothetical protein [unclassified Microbacterium]
MTDSTTKETTVPDTLTFADDPETLRITDVVQHAADVAYRARAGAAEQRFYEHFSIEQLWKKREAAGFTAQRWGELLLSTRNAASPEEFQRFADVLNVSPRWLAVGSGGIFEAPEGWSHFGSHIDTPGRLVFSKLRDDGGMPVWERLKEQEAA